MDVISNAWISAGCLWFSLCSHFYPEHTHGTGQNLDSTVMCHQIAINLTFNMSKPLNHVCENLWILVRGVYLQDTLPVIQPMVISIWVKAGFSMRGLSHLCPKKYFDCTQKTNLSNVTNKLKPKYPIKKPDFGYFYLAGWIFWNEFHFSSNFFLFLAAGCCVKNATVPQKIAWLRRLGCIPSPQLIRGVIDRRN